MEEEQDLRSALVRRLARGCIYSGSGNIFVLEERPSSSLASGAYAPGTAATAATLCYYCLLRDDGEDGGDTHPAESLVATSNEYVVCKEGYIYIYVCV